MFNISANTCCLCYNPELDKLIYESRFILDKLSYEKIKTLYYGYSCDKVSDEKIKKLRSYLNVLEEENRKIVLGGKPCLDCNDLQKLSEKARRLTISCDLELRKDLIVDRSGVDAYIAQNPYCVSREKWEKLAYTICESLFLDVTFAPIEECKRLGLEILSIEKACDLTFELTRKLIPCDIMIAIAVQRMNCDLDLKITRTEEECRLDFEVLKTETVCNIDFKTYRKLIDCNLSFDVVKTIYDNGCEFVIDEDFEGQVVMLKTPLNEYSLNEMSFKDVPDIEVLTNLGVDTEDSEYLKDPEGFIKKLNSDYGHEPI